MITLEQLDSYCREAVKGKSEITYQIQQSNKSESLYLYLRKDNTFYTIRFSSHYNKQFKMWDKECVIKSKTNKKLIQRTIANGIKALEQKQFYHLLKNL